MNDETSSERGQSIILIAVALAALIIFAAIAVDASNAYVQRRTAQNAADGAALAAGRELAYQRNDDAYDAGRIKAAMNDYAERNGIDDTDATPANSLNNNVTGYFLESDTSRLSDTPISSAMGSPVPDEAAGIEVAVTITAPTFFGGIVGANGMPVDATASVLLQPACGASCLVPIATHWWPFSDTLYITSCFNIWNGSNPGNFGWLNWSMQNPDACSCSEPCVEYNLDPSTCGSATIRVGDWIAGDSGVSNGRGIRNWLDYYRGTWPTAHDPVPFTVPVWDEADPGGGCSGGSVYRVAGFAKMQLLGYQLSRGQSYGHDGTGCLNLGDPRSETGNKITASFIEWVEGVPGNCDPIGTIWVPRLIR